MQKNKGEKGEHLLAGGEIRCDLRFCIPGRDKPVEIDEFLKPLPLSQLYNKRQYAECDDAVVDDWICLRSIGVADWYHCPSGYQSSTIQSMELSYPLFEPYLGEMMLLSGRRRLKTNNFSVKRLFLSSFAGELDLLFSISTLSLDSPNPT